MFWTTVATILAITGAILHKNVVSSTSHQAVPFVSSNARFANVGTTANISPFSIDWKKCYKMSNLIFQAKNTDEHTFLSNLSTKRWSYIRQMNQRFSAAIRQGKRLVVEWIGTLWVQIWTAFPAFYAKNWEISGLRGYICWERFDFFYSFILNGFLRILCQLFIEIQAVSGIKCSAPFGTFMPFMPGREY